LLLHQVANITLYIIVILQINIFQIPDNMMTEVCEIQLSADILPICVITDSSAPGKLYKRRFTVIEVEVMSKLYQWIYLKIHTDKNTVHNLYHNYMLG